MDAAATMCLGVTRFFVALFCISLAVWFVGKFTNPSGQVDNMLGAGDSIAIVPHDSLENVLQHINNVRKLEYELNELAKFDKHWINVYGMKTLSEMDEELEEHIGSIADSMMGGTGTKMLDDARRRYLSNGDNLLHEEIHKFKATASLLNGRRKEAIEQLKIRADEIYEVRTEWILSKHIRLLGIYGIKLESPYPALTVVFESIMRRVWYGYEISPEDAEREESCVEVLQRIYDLMIELLQIANRASQKKVYNPRQSILSHPITDNDTSPISIELARERGKYNFLQNELIKLIETTQELQRDTLSVIVAAVQRTQNLLETINAQEEILEYEFNVALKVFEDKARKAQQLFQKMMDKNITSAVKDTDSAKDEL